MDIGLAILRIVLGLLFVGHGTQKLFGWFGGHGLRGTGQWLESLGYRRGSLMALANGLAETVGGLLVAVGLLTPLGAAAIVGVMLNAIVAVHWRNGLWVTSGGSEYPLVNTAVAVALGFLGAGRWSLDRLLDLDYARILGVDPWWVGVFTVALGLVAGLLALAVRRAPAPVRAATAEAPSKAA